GGDCGVLRGLRVVAGRTVPTVPREKPSVREADRCFYAVQKRSSRAVIRHQWGPPRCASSNATRNSRPIASQVGINGCGCWRKWLFLLRVDPDAPTFPRTVHNPVHIEV